MSNPIWLTQNGLGLRLPEPSPTCVPMPFVGSAEVVEWRWRPAPQLSDGDVDRIARRVAELLREDKP